MAVATLPDYVIKGGGRGGSGSGQGGRPYREQPVGDKDGVNTVFTLSFTPWLGLVWLTLNGIAQDPFNSAAGVGIPEFTLSGNTITYAVAPKAEDSHWCWYFKGPAATTLSTLRARQFATVSDGIDWGQLNGAPFRLTGNMAFGVWVKPQSTTQGCIVRTGAGGGLSATTAWPYFMSLTGSSNNWDVIVGHDTASTNINNAGSPFPANLQDDEWVYLGFSRDATAKTYTLYKGDGSTISTVGVFTYSDNTDPLAGTDPGQHLKISCTDLHDYVVHFVGALEEHYIWSRAITSAEHAAAMAGAPSRTGLVLACPMGTSPEVDTSDTEATGTVSGTTIVEGH